MNVMMKMKMNKIIMFTKSKSMDIINTKFVNVHFSLNLMMREKDCMQAYFVNYLH